MSESVASKTIWGTAWSIVQKFGTLLINFISSMVLARLLSPDDYGCIGMLMIFVTLSQAFVDGGFASALIQKHNPTQTDLSTVFIWNVFLSICLYGIIYLAAPYIAHFYNIPLLVSVLRIMGLSLIINSFSIVHVAILQIQLQFKALAIRDIVSNLLSVILTIFLAYHGLGVWALVAQILSVGLFKSIILWITCTWRPCLSFSFQAFKSLFRFGGFMFLTNILNALGNNIQGLLIGRYATAVDMGYYSQGKKLSDVASTGFSSVVEQVAFPVMSGFNSDSPKSASSVLKKYLSTVAFFVIPLMLLLVLVSVPVITIVYSRKWLPVVPYFNLLCIAGIFLSLQAILQSSLAAKGESKVLFIASIIKRSLEISLMIAGLLLFSIKGLLIAMIISSVVSFLINAFLVHKRIGYRLKEMLKDLLPIALISFIAFIAALSIKLFITNNDWILYITMTLLFLGIYVSCSFFFKINVINDLRYVIYLTRKKKN